MPLASVHAIYARGGLEEAGCAIRRLTSAIFQPFRFSSLCGFRYGWFWVSFSTTGICATRAGTPAMTIENLTTVFATEDQCAQDPSL